MKILKIAVCLFVVLSLSQIENQDLFTLAQEEPSQENLALQEQTSQISEHLTRAQQYFEARDYQKAIEEFEKVLKLDPENKIASDGLIACRSAQSAALDFSADKLGKMRCQSEAPPPVETQISPEAPSKEEGIAQEPSESGAEELDYVIGNGDILDVSVWEWPDLDKSVTVRPDGKISFPLIGDVKASGLTITELDKLLTEKLKDYIRSPEVSIMLREFGAKKVVILGEVGYTGVYEPKGEVTILEAIALAGGFSKDSVSSSVILMRNVTHKPEVRRLNLTRAIVGKDLSQNVILQPQDIIYVPKKFIADVNYFVTEVLGPLGATASTVSTVQGAINLYHTRHKQ